MTGKSHDNVSYSSGSTEGDHLLFKARGVIERWNQGNATTMAELPAERNTRFNEAIANFQIDSGIQGVPKFFSQVS